MERLSSALAGRYAITRQLGAGGMATVYLAHDVRHDRKVALKVLKPELSAILGAERFLKEIRTTANLQHPHILPLHDSGEADGTVFYVMPFVEGETLRERLVREQQLPVEDAVRIAREVLDALAYAHTQGVIHRDIKPENILLHGGHALVADFGIALAASRSEGSQRLTETGMSLGTPAYMAPEQAMGEKAITPRVDVYALGCVLYELLSGEPPFTGPTAQAIVARVMTEEPRALTLHRHTIPPHVEAAVRRALEKLPADRWASAEEFGRALAGGGTEARRHRGTGIRSGRVLSVSPSLRHSVLPWTLLALVTAAALWGWLRPLPSPQPPPVERFTLTFGRSAALSDGSGSPVALSPDGSRLAYVGRDSNGLTRLFVRGMDNDEPAAVPGTSGVDQPFFSFDGRWIGFRQDGKLRKVALEGGAVVTIADIAGLYFGASWGPGDTIVFGHDRRIKRVGAAGGRPEVVAEPESAAVREAYRFPELLPDGRTALFTAVTDSGPELWAVSLDDGEVRPLGVRGMSPRYVDGGYLVYAELDGTLFSVPFDVRELRPTGTALPVTDGVRLGPAFVAKAGISRSGALAYLGGQTAGDLILADRAGRVQVLPTGQRHYSSPRWARDGRRIAMQLTDATIRGSTVNGDLWTWDLAARNLQRVTFDSSAIATEWSSDGRHLVYTRDISGARNVVYAIATDGSGSPTPLVRRPGPAHESSPTPDGRALVVREYKQGTFDRDLWYVPLDTTQPARPLLVTPFDERNPAVSPDGRWLAYASNETGAFEVYVRGLSEGSGRTRVSTFGGFEPRWAAGGRELLYRSNDSVYAVAAQPGAEFRADQPRALFGWPRGTSSITSWDASPDGQRFVLVRTPESDFQGVPLRLVLHWFDQLRASPR